MVLLVGTHLTRKSPCHTITMAMGWKEYVLKDEEVLKDESEVPQRPKRVGCIMIALLTPLLVSRLCTRRWTKMDIRPNIKPNSHI